ncbi:hypothetical protein V3851_07130 [Paenibacillus sp. M1]|uniref:Uncharacterized protein n=1 Tax=Paenibacillus haidiansis TaxID=1574488 RepID=A0ABU7VPB9_9BACL
MNKELANPRQIPPCKDPLICRTVIGKGDHEIEAIVYLYSLGGYEIDLIKVQFRKKSSFMMVQGTSETRVLLDQDKLEQDACFVSGLRDCPQTFRVRISYVPDVGKTGGRVFVQGILTDHFGRSPQSLTYLIAEWIGFTLDCSDTAGIPKNIERTHECGPLKIFVDIHQNVPGGFLNVAEIFFSDLSTNTYLVRDYKQGSRNEDPLILFNQNIEEHDVLLCPVNGIHSKSRVQLVWIRSIDLFIPQFNVCGKLCIDGMFMINNIWHNIHPRILAKWTYDGNECP